MDDIIVRDSEGQLAVNTVSGTEANVPYNYDDCFTVDTNGRRALRVVGSNGSDMDNRIIIKSATIPTGSVNEFGKIRIYDGETNATYTHGYIYECKKSATYTGTVSFEAATLSGTTVACDGDDFAAFLTEAGADPTPIVSGTMTYDVEANGWRLVGKNANNEIVTSFIEYAEDYADAGFTFTGVPVNDDVIAFTCSIEEDVVSYFWVRIDVQPAGAVINDNSTSLTETWSASKLNTTIGDIETLLAAI